MGLRVGVIGGGVAGLSCAYELAKAGHQVVVFERQAQLGGQASTFQVRGTRLERFYHHLFTADKDIVALLEELGLGKRLRWLESKVGYFCQGRIYPFVTPQDLLRFSPLGFLDRVRFGLIVLYLQRYKNWRKLEAITAQDWIIRYAGQRVYDVLWRPLLRGKFGDSYDQVSMTWFWGKVLLRGGSRGRSMQKERLGYLDGSFGLLIDGLEQAILERGGRVHKATPVVRIATEGGRATGVETERGITPFDRIVATVPSPVFLGLVPSLPAPYADVLRRAQYQSAACLILELNRSLSPIYWLNISDESIPFVGAIEHTNFIPSEAYGGAHLLYLSNYLSPGHPLYGLSASQLLAAYLPHLSKINPAFREDWVENRWLFCDAAAQPVVTTHYSEQVPDYTTPISGLYLANTTQIYPEDRGMNYSVRLGKVVSGIVMRSA